MQAIKWFVLALSLSLFSAISKMPRYEAGINRKRCASEKLTQDQAMTNSNSLRSGLGQLWAKQICWTSCPMPVFSCLASRDKTLNFRYWWNHWCESKSVLNLPLLSRSYLFVVPCFSRLSHPRSSHVCGGRLDEQRVWSLQHELFKTVNAVKTRNTRNLKSCYKIYRFLCRQNLHLSNIPPYALIYGLCITRDALPLVCLIHVEMPRVHLVQNPRNGCSRKPFWHLEDWELWCWHDVFDPIYTQYITIWFCFFFCLLFSRTDPDRIRGMCCCPGCRWCLGLSSCRFRPSSDQGAWDESLHGGRGWWDQGARLAPVKLIPKKWYSTNMEKGTLEKTRKL